MPTPTHGIRFESSLPDPPPTLQLSSILVWYQLKMEVFLHHSKSILVLSTFWLRLKWNVWNKWSKILLLQSWTILSTIFCGLLLDLPLLYFYQQHFLLLCINGVSIQKNHRVREIAPTFMNFWWENCFSQPAMQKKTSQMGQRGQICSQFLRLVDWCFVLFSDISKMATRFRQYFSVHIYHSNIFVVCILAQSTGEKHFLNTFDCWKILVVYFSDFGSSVLPFLAGNDNKLQMFRNQRNTDREEAPDSS